MRKSAHYRRCNWLNENMFQLQTVLEEALDLGGEFGLPTFNLSDDVECVVARQIEVNGRLFLNMVSFEHGAGAAVIPALGGAEAVDTDEIEPPAGMEYVQAQLLCLVEGNNVIWTTHNSPIREGSVAHFLRQFLAEHHNQDEAANFVLKADLNVEQLNVAFEEGIEEIDLKLGGFRSSLEEAFGIDPVGGDGFASHLRSFLRGRPTVEEMQAAAEVEMKVVLRPGKSWKKENVKEFLSVIGKGIYEERDELDEGFAIVTKSGLRLTRDKLTIHKPFSVDGNKRLVDPFQVRDRLDEILTQLIADGVV
jgi:hypothetical protein